MSIFQILDPDSPTPLPQNLCALAIMTKAPLAGKVKTRLSPPLSPAEAAQLNSCFLQDLSMSILQACEKTSARGIAVYTPVGAESVYEKILPPIFMLLPQRGEKFDERLTFAAQDLFAIGFRSVCLINSDSPGVPASSFAEAVSILAQPGDRIVLGPSHDGGYYLIGLKQLHHDLFREIDWSTERVLEQTRQRADSLAIPVHELPAGLDVDDAVSLNRLCRDLFDNDSHTAKGSAPATRKFLSEIIDREGRSRICGELRE